MRATLDEIRRLEESYLSMVLGIKDRDIVYSYVDVIPEADADMCVAFRFSEDTGLVSSDDVLGRPITMEMQVEEMKDLDESSRNLVLSSKVVYYRIPSVTKICVSDGDEVLLETRLPVYQLGRTVSIPL